MERRRTRRWYSAEQWSLDQLVKLVAKCDCLVIWLQLYSEFGNIAGDQTNRNNFGLSFGLKKGLRFHFDSDTCLNYPFLNIFLSVGNLKSKLKWFFKPKLKPIFFYWIGSLVDAPPKVLLALAAPREHRHARLRQRRSNLVLRRVDVARGPAHLFDAPQTTTVN